jgi:hypothetical protein
MSLLNILPLACNLIAMLVICHCLESSEIREGQWQLADHGPKKTGLGF